MKVREKNIIFEKEKMYEYDYDRGPQIMLTVLMAVLGVFDIVMLIHLLSIVL